MSELESQNELVVLSGSMVGRVFPLGSLTTIGRSSEADIALADGGVSRNHCRIEAEEGRLIVLDLGSQNGLRVNGVPFQREQLIHGDVISLGGVQLLFRGPNGGGSSGGNADDQTRRIKSGGPQAQRLAGEEMVLSLQLISLLELGGLLASVNAGRVKTIGEAIAEKLKAVLRSHRCEFISSEDGDLAERLPVSVEVLSDALAPNAPPMDWEDDDRGVRGLLAGVSLQDGVDRLFVVERLFEGGRFSPVERGMLTAVCVKLETHLTEGGNPEITREFRVR